MGTFVPTIKIASNSGLYRHKGSWRDADAGGLLTGQSMEATTESLFAQVMAAASEQILGVEEMGFREIPILKTGMTL